MSIESARAAIDEALTKALEGETAEVSPGDHGVSPAELSEIAGEQMAKRNAAGKLDIDFVTELREADGGVLFRPSRGL
jgi:hypothetical protein